MLNYDRDELAIILLDSYDGFEYKHKRAILQLYSKPEDIFLNPSRAIDYLLKEVDHRAANTLKQSINEEYLNFVLEKLSKRQVRALTYLSSDYPKQQLR